MNTTTDKLAEALRLLLQHATWDEDADENDRATFHAAETASQDALAEYDVQKDKPLRVLIHMDGGLIQGVISDPDPRLRVISVDYDNEGAAPQELTNVPQDDGDTSEAIVVNQYIGQDPSDVQFIDRTLAAAAAHDRKIEAWEAHESYCRENGIESVPFDEFEVDDTPPLAVGQTLVAKCQAGDDAPRAVMIKGNPVDGFTFVGPFASKSEAVDHYGDTVDTEWWVADLTPPEEH